MGSGSFPFFSEQWLVDSGQKDAGKFYSNKSEKVLIKLFQKVMLAFGKLRLCLVGSRLHFPSENRQSRARSKIF